MRCNPVRLMSLLVVGLSLAACDNGLDKSKEFRAVHNDLVNNRERALERAKQGPTEQDMRNLELANKWFGNRDPRMTNDSLKRLQEAEQQQPRRYGR